MDDVHSTFKGDYFCPMVWSQHFRKIVFCPFRERGCGFGYMGKTFVLSLSHDITKRNSLARNRWRRTCKRNRTWHIYTILKTSSQQVFRAFTLSPSLDQQSGAKLRLNVERDQKCTTHVQDIQSRAQTVRRENSQSCEQSKIELWNCDCFKIDQREDE